MRFRWLALVMLALGVPVTAAAGEGAAAGQANPSAAAIFAESFNGLDGKPVALSFLQGKVAVVNFWATWCAPCRKEIPDLVEAHQKYQARDVAFVGIAVEDGAERVGDFAKAYGMNYPILLGEEKGIALLQALGNAVAGLPFTVVIDARGNIVATKRGAMDRARLERALQDAGADQR